MLQLCIPQAFMHCKNSYMHTNPHSLTCTDTDPLTDWKKKFHFKSPLCTNQHQNSNTHSGRLLGCSFPYFMSGEVEVGFHSCSAKASGKTVEPKSVFDRGCLFLIINISNDSMVSQKKPGKALLFLEAFVSTWTAFMLYHNSSCGDLRVTQSERKPSWKERKTTWFIVSEQEAPALCVFVWQSSLCRAALMLNIVFSGASLSRPPTFPPSRNRYCRKYSHSGLGHVSLVSTSNGGHRMEQQGACEIHRNNDAKFYDSLSTNLIIFAQRH